MRKKITSILFIILISFISVEAYADISCEEKTDYCMDKCEEWFPNPWEAPGVLVCKGGCLNASALCALEVI